MAQDLGTRLVREGLLGRAELERALAFGTRSRRPLPFQLAELGLLDEDTLVRFFRSRFPFEEATRSRLGEVVTEIAVMVPREMSEEFGVIAVDRQDTTLMLAMVDPSNTHAIDEVAFCTGCYVVPMVARPSDLSWARDQLYPVSSDTAPIRVPLELTEPDDDAVLELVTRRVRATDVTRVDVPVGANQHALDPGVSQVVTLDRPRVPTSEDWTLGGFASGDGGSSLGPDAPQAPVLVVSNLPPPTYPGPDPAVTGVHRVRHATSPGTTAPLVPPTADLATLLARLHRCSDRDEAIDLAVSAAALVCRRAAFFVIKKAVAQGWDARGQGVIAGAIRNVWIPISSPSVLRQASSAMTPYVGAMPDTIANGILVAALGNRANQVGVWPVVVRERTVALLYADGFAPQGVAQVDEIVQEVAQAFERIILEEKSRR